jgi:hypothetical protein
VSPRSSELEGLANQAPNIKQPNQASETTEQLPPQRSESKAEPKSEGFQMSNLQNTHFRTTDLESFLCLLSVKYNLPIVPSAVVWIVVAAIAFMNPLISFSRFISRWFQSDTIAFLAICTFAGMASMMLFWLHVFLQILTILTAETLARLDLQLSRVSSSQAFWVLLTVSLAGLASGLGLRFVVSY